MVVWHYSCTNLNFIFHFQIPFNLTYTNIKVHVLLLHLLLPVELQYLNNRNTMTMMVILVSSLLMYYTCKSKQYRATEILSAPRKDIDSSEIAYLW